MRVFFINSVCAAGSTGRIMAELARLIEARGDIAMMAYGRGEAYDDICTYKIGTKADFYAHVLKTRLSDRTGTGSIPATKRLVSVLNEWKPDVVHLGNIHGYYIHVPTLMHCLKSMDIPIIWTLHDCWSFTGHCSHFTDVGCARWKTGCFQCPKRGVYPASWFLDRSTQVYAWKRALFSGFQNLTIVAPSHWLKHCLGQSFLKQYPVQVIENGIDLSVFRPVLTDFRERHGLLGYMIALGVATPWDERKGLFDFIELSKRLPKEWKVVMVALTKKQMKLLPSNILGLERTDCAKELNQIYSSANVYVNPTYCDTFPTTNLEALASGTPVVTYDVGGSPEALTEDCGVAVTLGDIGALTQAVLSAPDRFSRAACAKRGRMFKREERFSPYLELYEQCCNRSKP